MDLVTRFEDKSEPLSPEQEERLSALAAEPTDDTEYPEWDTYPPGTPIDERTATLVRMSDFSSVQEAREVARELSRMRRMGIHYKEIQAYKESRMRSPVTV